MSHYPRDRREHKGVIQNLSSNKYYRNEWRGGVGGGGPGRGASIETGFRRKPINRAREISMPAGNEAAP